MKTTFILFFLVSTMAFAQVGIGTTSPDASAILELDATDKGFLPPRVSVHPSDPAKGLIVYFIPENCLQVNVGTPAAPDWQCFAGGAGSSEGSIINSGDGELTSSPTASQGGSGGTFSFTGKIFFDVVESAANDNLNCGTHLSRQASKADFSSRTSNQQIYTFTSSVPVDNIRFGYMNTNGNVVTSLLPFADYSGSGFSEASFMAFYDTSLNTTANGTTDADMLTADLFVIYTLSGTDYQLKITSRVKDCAWCGAMISPTEWKNFLCHNLGADYNLDPFTPAAGIDGAYIQWGKRGPNTTGDSRNDWKGASSNGSGGFREAPVASTTGAQFYTGVSGWSAVDAANTSWQDGTNTANDPCPTGYRLPTQAEWDGVFANNAASINQHGVGSLQFNPSLNYDRMFYFTPPGSSEPTLPIRPSGNLGTSTGAGSSTHNSSAAYWSSSSSGTSGVRMSIFSNAAGVSSISTSIDVKRRARQVRCIQE